MRVLLAVVTVASMSFAARPNLDAFQASQQVVPVIDVRGLPAGDRALIGSSSITAVEPRLGVPKFVWTTRLPMPQTYRAIGLTAVEAARRHLMTWAPLYRADASRWAELQVTQVHDLGQGAVIVAFQQRVHGVRLFRDELKVIMTHDLELVALSGFLTPQLKPTGAFALSDRSALAAAFADLSGRTLEDASLKSLGTTGGYTRFTLAGQATPARARPVYFPLADGLEPGFYVELNLSQGQAGSDYFSYVISAKSGQVLFRHDLTQSDFSYRVFADTSPKHMPIDGPQGAGATPHPTGLPNGFNPGFVAPTLVTWNNGPISTNDPWLAAGATQTQGNNIYAYADLGAPDGFSAGDLVGAFSGPGAFDRTYDPLSQPNANTDQQNAVIAQLFYDDNFFHDWYYDVGFDEKSGNAQASNFGRGGLEGDVFLAEAQDYSGRNNSNMATPSDGASPRQQMYIFDGATSTTLTVGSATYLTAAAAFGPSAFTVTAELVVAQNGTATDACTAITNNVMGKIALVDRGTCTFAVKAQAAQTAGALAVIIADNRAGATPPAIQAGPGSNAITIGVVSVTQADGVTLHQVAAGTMATITGAKTPDADGAEDTAIVAHEWGHYISNRLIGDGNGIANQQAIGMGEGWADFHSMLVLVRAEDLQVPANANWNGVYAMAGYTSYAQDKQGYYFGIRRVPYSTDLTKNGLTFKHIQDGVALPANVPTAFGQNGAQNSEVHNTGEVWATMLWECYAGLLRDPRYTFVQAQDHMRAYLVAAYKMTALTPTFVDARDALLAAAAATDLTDYATFWTAFAKRGLGMKAVAPPPDVNSPLTESFEVGNDVKVVSVTVDDSTQSCDHDGQLDANESGVLTVVVRNTGVGMLTATQFAVTTSAPGVTFPSGATQTLMPMAPFATATVKVPVALANVAGVQTDTFTVTLTDPSLLTSPVTHDASMRLNVDIIPTSSATDDVEAPTTVWTSASDPNGDTSSNFRIVAASASDHFWFGPNPSSPADVWLISPRLDVTTGVPFVITFQHRWAFESDATGNYDGAVIELSVNGGAWTDVGAHATPGYTGVIFQGQGQTASSNPLAGQKGYVAQSPNYPAFKLETVDLGTDYGGKSVNFRFRIGSDDAVAAKGWEIDDIAFHGISNRPFTTVVSDPNTCTNRAPTAVLGPDLVVNEGDQVVLTATTSDPDGDPVSQSWVQSSGPLVTITQANTFVAPMVTADTQMTFDLSVSDGRAVVGPFTQKVLVKNVNHAPVATVPASQQANEGDAVTVAGSGTDADGDPLTYQWSQVSGPAVTLTQDTTDTVAFTAPTVTADAVVTLQLIVSDPTTASAPAKVEVTIKAAAKKGCGCSTGSDGVVGLALLALGLHATRRRRE